MSKGTRVYPRNTARDLWAKVDSSGGPDACWPFTGRKDYKGYGRMSWNNRERIASRIAWMVTHGDPGSLCVCHRCDNPPCCNPAHLFLGTVGDNTRDARDKGRLVNFRGGVHGERHGSAKLTRAIVAAIRADSRTTAAIARELGVSESAVARARNGQTWGEKAMNAEVSR